MSRLRSARPGPLAMGAGWRSWVSRWIPTIPHFSPLGLHSRRRESRVKPQICGRSRRDPWSTPAGRRTRMAPANWSPAEAWAVSRAGVQARFPADGQLARSEPRRHARRRTQESSARAGCWPKVGLVPIWQEAPLGPSPRPARVTVWREAPLGQGPSRMRRRSTSGASGPGLPGAGAGRPGWP